MVQFTQGKPRAARKGDMGEVVTGGGEHACVRKRVLGSKGDTGRSVMGLGECQRV